MMFKPIVEAYPDKLGWKYKGYNPLIESMGYKICVKYDTYPSKDQIGETIILFHNGITKKYGILMYEWGYCSATDPLQACETLEEVKTLRRKLKDQIHWEAKSQMSQYLITYLKGHEKAWNDMTALDWIWSRIWKRIGHQFLLKLKNYVETHETYIGSH